MTHTRPDAQRTLAGWVRREPDTRRTCNDCLWATALGPRRQIYVGLDCIRAGRFQTYHDSSCDHWKEAP